MPRELPGSVSHSILMLRVIVATSALITLLIWLMRDQVILGWATGNERAQVILDEGGIEQLRSDQIVPGFVALAIVAFVGFAALALVLGSFLRGGHGWTRPVLTASAAVGVLVGAVCLDNHLPSIFTLLSGLIILEGLVLIYFLWRPATTAYVRHL